MENEITGREIFARIIELAGDTLCQEITEESIGGMIEPSKFYQPKRQRSVVIYPIWLSSMPILMILARSNIFRLYSIYKQRDRIIGENHRYME